VGGRGTGASCSVFFIDPVTFFEDSDQGESPATSSSSLSQSSSANPITNVQAANRKKKFIKSCFDRLFKHLVGLETTYQVGDEVKRFKTCEFFLDPVDKATYPNYYDVIASAICLNEMKEKADRLHYNMMDEMMEDIELMCANAQSYNSEGTYAWNDARYIRVRERNTRRTID
jgi:hypothetical protein